MSVRQSARMESSVIVVAAFLGASVLAHALLSPEYVRVPIARRVQNPRVETTVPPRSSGAAAIADRGPAEASETLQERQKSTQEGRPRRVRLALAGLNLEIFGIAWFLLVLVMESIPRKAGPETHARFRLYLFCWSVVGMSGVFWSLYEVSLHWDLVAVQYRTAIACVVTVFLVSALSHQGTFKGTFQHAPRDVVLLARHVPLWIAMLGYGAVIAAQPEPSLGAAGVPTGPAFDAWFQAQPRVSMPISPGNALLVDSLVLIVKFNDYQCPPCKRTHLTYGPVIERLNREYPGAIHFLTLDYPLEPECNPYAASETHPAACEAAAAVRLARTRGRDAPMEEWIWANQARLSRETLFQAMRKTGGVVDPERQYAAILEQVRADVGLGRELGVRGTPTYFVNGVRLPPVSSQQFERAILLELRRRGALPAR